MPIELLALVETVKRDFDEPLSVIDTSLLATLTTGDLSATLTGGFSGGSTGLAVTDTSSLAALTGGLAGGSTRSGGLST